MERDDATRAREFTVPKPENDARRNTRTAR
jgi:hypothetical protein